MESNESKNSPNEVQMVKMRAKEAWEGVSIAHGLLEGAHRPAMV